MEQYNVTGMSCAACSARVEKAVGKVEGVTSCSVSLLTNSMGVEGSASAEAIIKAVGIPQNIFQGYGAKKTITILSGLSFPITYLTEIKENAEEKYKERMEHRDDGRKLKALTLDEPKQQLQKQSSRKVSRLEMLRALNDKKR